MKSGFDRIGHTVTLPQAKRSCLDKVRYESRNKARDRAVFLTKKYPGSQPTKPYRCTLCGQWHLATIRPAGKGKDRRKARGGQKAA